MRTTIEAINMSGFIDGYNQTEPQVFSSPALQKVYNKAYKVGLDRLYDDLLENYDDDSIFGNN